MSERYFLDTNVFVYAADGDAGDKQSKALALVERAYARAGAVISMQVLQEYFVVATRKLGVAAAEARRHVELMGTLDTVVIDLEMVLRAIDRQRLHGLSFWDALIVSCAAASGCERVLTEDMQHGQRLDGVLIDNPFR